GGDGEGPLEAAVAAFDDLLALVAGQHLPGIGLGPVEVGEQAVPAVGGRFVVEGALVEVPLQGRFGVVVGPDAGPQVVPDASLGGDDGQPGADLLGVGVVAAAQPPGEGLEVFAGSVQLLGSGRGRGAGIGGGPHEDPAQWNRPALVGLGRRHGPAVLAHSVAAPGLGGLG